MALQLSQKVKTYLKNNPNRKFTAKEIASWIFQTYPEACRLKQQRSQATKVPLNSDDALIQQIASEIGARRKDFQRQSPSLKVTEERPRQFYYTDKSDRAEILQIQKENTQNLSSQTQITKDQKTTPSPHLEIHLYPKLSEFLWAELNLYSKRIDEKVSKNSNGPKGNKWLYPDLVGLEILDTDWHQEIKDCVQQYGGRKTKLWSFEVKTLLNRSNVREAFFQTVSNSSWANFSYLVADQITGADTLKELSILSSLHGVGFIKLNHNDIQDSQILIPARERQEVDWNIANRLAHENKDFLNYIKSIRQFYQIGEIYENHWDIPENFD